MSFTRQQLHFREVDEADLSMLRDLRNTAWAGYRDPTSVQTPDQQRAWYYSLGPDNQAYIVEDAAGSGVEGMTSVGLLRFGNFDRVNRAVTITGVDVFIAHRSHGYATKIMRAAAEYMLHDLGFHRIVGECTSDNIGMKKAMEKAGYTLEGCKRAYIWRSGQWWDFLQYSLLSDELWPEDQQKPAEGL